MVPICGALGWVGLGWVFLFLDGVCASALPAADLDVNQSARLQHKGRALTGATTFRLHQLWVQSEAIRAWPACRVC